jgi:hypothetical protein
MEPRQQVFPRGLRKIGRFRGCYRKFKEFLKRFGKNRFLRDLNQRPRSQKNQTSGLSVISLEISGKNQVGCMHLYKNRTYVYSMHVMGLVLQGNVLTVHQMIYRNMKLYKKIIFYCTLRKQFKLELFTFSLFVGDFPAPFFLRNVSYSVL